MTALPPAQWYLGYRPSAEDFQHISDEAVGRVQGLLSGYVASPAAANLDMGGHRVVNASVGAAATDLARLDQVAERYLATYTVASGGILVPLPNVIDTFALDLRDITANAATQYYVRVSVDGGATFLNGASEYGYCVSRASTNPVFYSGQSNLGFLTTNQVQVYNNYGTIIVEPASKTFGGVFNAQFEIHTFNNFWTTAGSSVSLLITGVSSLLTTGRVRLLQKVW